MNWSVYHGSLVQININKKLSSIKVIGYVWMWRWKESSHPSPIEHQLSPCPSPLHFTHFLPLTFAPYTSASPSTATHPYSSPLILTVAPHLCFIWTLPSLSLTLPLVLIPQSVSITPFPHPFTLHPLSFHPLSSFAAHPLPRPLPLTLCPHSLPCTPCPQSLSPPLAPHSLSLIPCPLPPTPCSSHLAPHFLPSTPCPALCL